jgi:pimeloyl-ACP methyl ester carboxylesterase
MSSDTTTQKSTADAAPRSSRIDEGAFFAINGLEQWLTFRGDDRASPALLVLGGPGVGLGAFAPLFADWERHFVVVQWDQPGGGATHALNGDATGDLTIERLVRDAIAVVELARARLAKKRVALLGASAGSILSLAIASRRPDLLSACVGTGQFVDWARQDASSYARVLARARAARDAVAVAELERIGPPPYRDTATDAIKSKYAGAFTPAEAAALAAVRPALATPPADATYVPRGLALGDPRALSLAAYDKLRADIVSFDARRLGRSFRVPMFFFQGEHDLYSVTDDVRDYVAEIDAPRKLLALVPGAGHSALFATGAMLELLLAHVRPVALEADGPATGLSRT